MHGEYSRLSFDARKHVSAVLNQQGRVGLDADWNEAAEVALRRLAIETIDVIGACGQPKHAPGFVVSVPTGADVTLSAGRLYAGGMLAELEADTKLADQLDWPVPPESLWNQLFPNGPAWPGLDLSDVGDGKRRIDLFYVEVWNRHLSAINHEALRAQAIADAGAGQPDWDVRPSVGDPMRESALGGPDTATRLQTVAQVKYLTVEATTCEEACQALADTVPRASTGKMQVDVTEPPPVTNPCTEPQVGGYGGAENRTYRVEIHTPGAAGAAEFKYSTENGAFMVRVAADALTTVAGTTDLTLLSVGNDDTTRLRQDDWVEMCGEETELGVFRNPLAQIVAEPVALADGRWKVQLTEGVVVPHAPFLRRWSGPPQTVALGKAFPLDTGSGLSVRFTDTNGTTKDPSFFHDLDFWIFSARTVTREVEPATLTHVPEPPRGIERAYCCLALVTWLGEHVVNSHTDVSAETVIQCGEVFPPLTELDTGCSLCTICVGDGETSHGEFDGYDGLLKARDKLCSEGGGTICLLPGRHVLEDVVRFQECTGVVVCGSRLGTVVVTHGTMAFRFEGCHGVEVSDLGFEVTDPRALGPIDGVVRFTVSDPVSATGSPCADVRVERCDVTFFVEKLPVEQPCAAVLIEDVRDLPPTEDVATVRDCRVWIEAPGPFVGFAVRRTTLARIEDSVVSIGGLHGSYGIDIDDDCDRCVVERNVIEAPPLVVDRPVARGGIHVGSGCVDVVVRGNRITGGAGCGVTLGSLDDNGATVGGLQNVTIEQNDIQQTGLSGIGIGHDAGRFPIQDSAPITSDLVIRTNRITACAFLPAPAVRMGPLYRAGGGIVLALGEGMRILDNDVRDCGHTATGDAPPHAVAGILVAQPGAGLAVERNAVFNNHSATEADPDGAQGSNAGICVFDALPGAEADSSLTISGNDVATDGAGPALLIDVAGDKARLGVLIASNHLTSARQVFLARVIASIVQFHGNHTTSRNGDERVIDILARHTTFSANHCSCRPPVPRHVHIAGVSVDATGNHCLESGPNPGSFSIFLEALAPPPCLVAVANITTNAIQLTAPGINVNNVLGVRI